jgi:hypothetical protein
VKKILFIPAVSLIATVAAANEMFATPPSEYLISGMDINGESAYQIHAFVDHSESEVRLTKLSVTIYEHSITISSDLLDQVRDPDFGSISVANDVGIHGSFFYLEIPFGKAFTCSARSGKERRKTLFIDNLPTMDGGGLQARVHNVCDFY